MKRSGKNPNILSGIPTQKRLFPHLFISHRVIAKKKIAPDTSLPQLAGVA
jgi:hypothetical protein